MRNSRKHPRTEYTTRFAEAGERLEANKQFQAEIVALVRKYGEDALADYVEKHPANLLPSRLPTHDYNDLAERKFRYDTMRSQHVPDGHAIAECFGGVDPDVVARILAGWRQVREMVAEKKKLSLEKVEYPELDARRLKDCAARLKD
ncbi:MAG: hypothetical protein JZU55_19490 [Afipia sp.]|nr:hypothetical protein [Afipia sp.]